MDNYYERYWERIGPEQEHSDFKRKWPILKPLIPSRAGVRILDFGCGNGTVLREIEKVNSHAVCFGLDVSERAVEAAKRNLPHGTFYKIEDGGKFPLEDASIDFVFSSEVIEHVYDTDNSFLELRRILKPGGGVLLTTPYHGFVKNLLITFSGFDRHFNVTGPHVRFFSKKSLFQLLKRNGFLVLQHGYFGRFYPIPHCIFVLAQKQEHSSDAPLQQRLTEVRDRITHHSTM